MKGIDVSYCQGMLSQEWFEQVKAQGIEFVICKLGLDAGEDETFRNNFFNAYNAGLKTGIYVYGTARNYQEAVDEANWTIAKLKEIGIINMHIPMGIWYDWELFNSGLSAEVITDVMVNFYEALKNYGIDKVGIYSGYSLLWDETYLYSRHSEIPIWCAQYGSRQCDYPNAEIWQYSSDEIINGVNCDTKITLEG